MKVLDLFCGAGGAAMGIHRALPDAHIIGVDIKPQKHYPFTFVQADAMHPPFDLKDFDFIWASPPCQEYSNVKTLLTSEHPKLIEPLRNRLRLVAVPWVIENVPGAPLQNPTLLCGAMFGLRTYRHRLFETSREMPLVLHPGHGARQNPLRGSAKDRNQYMIVAVGHCSYAGEGELRKQAMDIDWMDQRELAQAIPPAYSEFIVRQIFPGGVTR